MPLVPAAGALASGLFLVILGLTHVDLQKFLHTPGGPGGEHYKDVLTWWVVSRDLLMVVLYALLVWLLRRSPMRRSA